MKCLLPLLLSILCCEAEPSITNSIHFYRNGAGFLSIAAAGTNILSIARIFGLSEADLKTMSLMSYLGESVKRYGLVIKSEVLETNGAHVLLRSKYAFSSPDVVLKWLDDNTLVRGKYINWSPNTVKLRIRLSDEYEDNVFFCFAFEGYRIAVANGILMDSASILWRPNNDTKVLCLEAHSQQSESATRRKFSN